MLVSVLILVLYDTIFGHTVNSKPYYDIEKASDYFEEFVVKFNKTYFKKEEKERRFEIFKNILININEWNAESESVVFAITKFSDLTPEEFEKFYTGFKMDEISRQGSEDCVNVFDEDVTTKTAPEHSFDWRDYSVVTDVKAQLLCGSCWAFAATGVVEGQYALKQKQNISLSAQQLVDCDLTSARCSGGFAQQALSFLINQGGQMSDADYPYTATENNCRFNETKIIARVTNCYEYNLKDEEKLKEILYTKGPVAIAIEFSFKLAHGYYGGIIRPDQYCGPRVNHAVLLVGYGITDQSENTGLLRTRMVEIGENMAFLDYKEKPILVK